MGRKRKRTIMEEIELKLAEQRALAEGDAAQVSIDGVDANVKKPAPEPKNRMVSYPRVQGTGWVISPIHVN